MSCASRSEMSLPQHPQSERSQCTSDSRYKAKHQATPVTMGEKSLNYLSQLKAMLIRNLLLKKREKRKTIAEVFLPLYSLGILIILKVVLPNPNFPVLNTPRGDSKLFEHFSPIKNHTVAVVPNSTETADFLDAVNSLWMNLDGNAGAQPINFVFFQNEEDLMEEYWEDPLRVPIAVIFHDDPTTALEYEIKTNPSFTVTPQTTELYSLNENCREKESYWASVFPIETGDSCPVNQYYYSGFLALQALLDYTKIGIDTGRSELQVPKIQLELFPKDAFTGYWMVFFRVVIPWYMVIALSQFITYLLILIVGEKEKKIKEGMKIMGLHDSVFWLSWFLIYAAFTTFLSVISCVLLFSLQVFQHTNYILIFFLILLYSFSVIMFGFIVTPFFDNAKTAGILGNFAVNFMSFLYFIQVFVSDSSSALFWAVSLISPTGFALAMDKALVMDLSGEGVTLENIWGGNGIPFGGSLIMMALDTVLYGFLAFYLDSVIPSEYGVKQKPWFCFTSNYWCPKKSVPLSPLVNGESGSFNVNDDASRDVEPVAREMKGREAIRIVDLYKTFHDCRKPEVQAVNGINLTIYEGQITAILGHNGAGKTTLFNILTGLTAPTSGTVFIFGYDVRDGNDMNRIRQMTGVCQQHDILFDLLTPREHLEFFAVLRGLTTDQIEAEVSKTLKDIDLVDKADTFAKYLSGGQKRKLSVGIAVIGDPKIIILDEPTAGVDPYSRRHMWSVLQNRRHGKVILLTTHFMDEADILADRKAVVSKGKLRCCGSSLFLKNKFGIGYHLTLVLDSVSREHAIARFVASYVPKSEKARRHGRELSFILPHNAVENFAPLFSALETEIKNKTLRLGVSSYGVSMTTLEEVFLHLERDDETECPMDNLSKEMVRNRALSRSLSLQSKSTSYQSLQNESGVITSTDKPEIPLPTEKAPLTGSGFGGYKSFKTKPTFYQTLLALLRLRALRMFRDLQKLYIMIAVPLTCAALGLYMNTIQDLDTPQNSLSLSADTYNRTRLAIFNGTNSNLDSFYAALKKAGFEDVAEYDGNYSALLNLKPHIAAFNINVFTDNSWELTAIYNDTAQHSLPIVFNLLSNAMYRVLAGDRDFEPITVKSHPFQQTSQPEMFNIWTFTSALCIGMTFVLVPVSLAVDMVYDREIKARNQLRVNGLSFHLYFLTYLIVLGVLMIFICSALLLLIFIFNLPSFREIPAILTLGILIVLYCPSSILCCTCLSYIFDKAETALSILPNIATFAGFIPFTLVIVLDMLKIGGRAVIGLHILFSLVNTLYIPYAIIYFVDRVYIMCLSNPGCSSIHYYDYLTSEIIVMAASSLLHIPFWLFVLLIVDVKKSGGTFSDVLKIFLKKAVVAEEDIIDNPDVGEHEDLDVKNERARVAEILSSQLQNPPVVVLQNLRKEYIKEPILCGCCSRNNPEPNNKLAVRNLSVAVEAGEVLGLLGHNGAGKTTTMKIIIAEESASRGRVQIRGHNITSNLNEAFQLLGYCPQHDAQWKNITVREHLECYAAIRGVPSGEISRVVEMYLQGLQIGEHANKQSQHCSGGTKRKLSFAMAMVGDPCIVLMDEPSTGMDPRSKRFLWDTILASFQGTRGAILTTHSMEEADALCSRVGIMVKGELRCIGSTQHLKNLYGAGYTLEMKLRNGDSTPTTPGSNRTDHLKIFVQELFPDAFLVESFADRLVFGVPQSAVTSLAECFNKLEKAKLELNIEEYSFSQTTLEQVFLKFAQYDELEVEQ